jgi:hypothetical protein
VPELLRLLDNVAKLEARSAKSKTAKGALQTLAQRGFDAAERQRLRALADRARGLVHSNSTALAAQAELRRLEQARPKALLALYHWHADWAATARQIIKRRDQLVLLGLTDRRRARTAEPTA